MSKSYEILEYMHNSIYTENDNKPYTQRKTKIFFSEPEGGINEDTGILLLIAGFGASANSKVYQKMREKFSDVYNLVTIQCDYFGCEFMQNSKSIIAPKIKKSDLFGVFTEKEINEIYHDNKLNFSKLINIGSKYNINLNLKEDLSDENLENFNDMGIMQALDNIVAVLKVMSIIYENGYEFNTRKVIIYGYSHGGYLGYLCNRLAPYLFSHLIDNSAWLYSKYFLNERILIQRIGSLNINITFDYLAKRNLIYNKVLDLNFLYSGFDNNCKIIVYQGNKDELIGSDEKKKFCDKLYNIEYNEISHKEVDSVIFKSTTHGLGADFLKLFDYSVKKLEFCKDASFKLEDTVIETDERKYYINYNNIFPILTIFNPK